MTDIQNLKRQFEEYIRKENVSEEYCALILEQDAAGNYSTTRVQAAWQGFQAHAASIQPTILALIQRIEEQHALLIEAQAVLSSHWFASNDGEDYNNEDVIDADERISAYIAAQSTKEQG